TLARTLIDSALALAKTLGAPSAELCLSLARVHRAEARRSKAADTLAEAERLTGEGPLRALIEAERAEGRELEGDAAGAAQAYEKALTMSDAAQELARWHGEIDLTARLQARLAGAYHTKKDMTQARKLYEASLSRWQMVGWPFAEARVLMNLGTLFIHGKEPAVAARHFESASVAANHSGDLMLQARALLQQAKALKQANQSVSSKTAAAEVKRLAMAIGWDEGKAQAEGLI
ncbi:MAG: hypothetical protein JNG84_01300, partial [Archangium sp.]|nr:hypothetical protein [Archangium sp.]